MAHGGERPDGLAVAPLLANADVVPRHEFTREAVVYNLYARQPLNISYSVPARGDQPDRETVLRRKWLTVHFVAQQVVGVEGFVERHAARELLGYGQIKSAACIGLYNSRLATTDN